MHLLSPGSAWTTGASFPSMQSSQRLGLAWLARSLNSLGANLKKAHPVPIFAPTGISRPPCAVFTRRATSPVRDTTHHGRQRMELRRVFPLTNRLLSRNLYVADG